MVIFAVLDNQGIPVDTCIPVYFDDRCRGQADGPDVAGRRLVPGRAVQYEQ